MNTVQASQRLAAHGIQITPIVIARYCRMGKIRGAFTAKGRVQREWDISDEALTHYIESRRGTTPSSQAKAGWEQRRRLDFAKNQRHHSAYFTSYDDVEIDDRRSAALNGHKDGITHLQDRQHLLWWWNAEKGMVAGSVDVDEIKRHAEQVMARRPVSSLVTAYMPGVG